MSIWNSLFSGTNVVEKGVDAVVKTGDALVFTDEERVDYHMKFLALYEPFKIAQRFLALIVGIPYVALFLVCGVAYLVAAAFIDPAECLEAGCRALPIQEAALEVGKLNHVTLGNPFWTIIGFYLLGS